MSSVLLTFVCFLCFSQNPATDQASTSTTPAVPLEARNHLEPVPIPVIPAKVTADKSADLEHSATFRKAAEEAWRATRNGTSPYEVGFSIDQDGRPGKIQLSMFATVNAKTHLRIASSPAALGTLHVHTRYGEPTPSQGDINSAIALHKVVYVESRTGLYRIDPDGNVRHVFDDPDWFLSRSR